ncbi:MAG: DNA gyrase subunit A [Solirubrobacteraceae bacterium]|nr:DNA gyrase subunit A [Solirubrobacteraceae bacterium]
MSSSDLIGGGNIEPRALEDEMHTAYLDYAMSVIVGRALPDARDGLKPVHRRVLFSMNENGQGPSRPYSKSAAIVGDVMGKYHPHGDSSIYDTLVRMAQPHSLRYMLIDGQGNFGSIDDDPAAAMRYTEARLSRIAVEMLRDLDSDTVDFQPNYDGSKQEPVVLPSRFPNMLVNGGSGIAVGMATKIPPHNLREITAGVLAFIDNPDITTEELLTHIKGPDFPTAGIILGRQGIADAYETGRGKVRVRAKMHVEDIGRGKEALIVTELPFEVKKGGDNGVIVKIADLVRDKRIPEISNIQDESDRRGMRLVIELKRDVIPDVVRNKLYKHTAMQTTFGVNIVALVDNVPRTLSLKECLRVWVEHQREVIVRRSKHELGVLERRVHVLEGLLIALDHLDEVIQVIRASRDRETARAELMSRFDLSEVQSSAILDLRLSQLTALEADAIAAEHKDKRERIGELRAILGDERRIFALIKEELQEIADRFGDDRRTLITDSEDEIDIEDLIADQQMVITITHTGYIKSLPLGTYRSQNRGGRGVTGMNMKDGDFIEHLFVCSSHDFLLFFSNRGKVYRKKVYELPEASRTAKGRALVNILPLREGERIQSVLSTRDFKEGPFLVFATKNGIIAIKIREDDELIAVRRTSGDDDILMVSRKGQAVRFHEDATRAMGRDTSGVRGMDVSSKGDAVLAMDVAKDDDDLLVVTENGFGKRSSIDQYRKTNRGTKGVGTIKLTDAKGALAGALVVREHDGLVFISKEGMVQRTAVRGINRYGRLSQGVKVMNVREDDIVSAVAVVFDSDDDEDGPGADTLELALEGELPGQPGQPEGAPADDDGDDGDDGDEASPGTQIDESEIDDPEADDTPTTDEDVS